LIPSPNAYGSLRFPDAKASELALRATSEERKRIMPYKT
jgi:hypothetical protein